MQVPKPSNPVAPLHASAGLSQPVPPAQNPVARLHIFRAGRHTSGNGITRTYSAAELAACAAAYDPARFAAPLVVGHPSDNSPAYGWVKRLESPPRELFAEVDAVDPLLQDAIRVGMYRKVSASLYLPESSANPVPGVLYLRHVGLLGGAAPAVKGLVPVTLAEVDGVADYTEAIDFCRNQSEQGVPSMSDQNTELAAFKAKLLALEAANADLKASADAAAAALQQHKREAVHAEHAAFAEALAKAGRLLPAALPVVVATLDHLAESAADFAEGGSQKPLAKALRDALAALPVAIPLGEVAAEHGEAAGGAASFAAPAGFDVDSTRLDLHRKALAHAATHNISYDAALAVVAR